MAVSLRRRRLIAAVVTFTVLCTALAVLRATTISRGQPRPSKIHHAPRPDDALEIQDAGGTPYGGEIESIVFAAGTSPIVYASFSFGGVFRSANLGRTWMAADRGLPPTIPCELAADPLRRDTLYAACIGRLFKTVDGGSRWQQLDVDDAELPIIAPSDSRVIYQTSGGMVSTDGGRRWTVRRRDRGEWSRVPEVAIDPTDPWHLVAASDAGVEHSHDGGFHWRVLNAGLDPDHNAQALAIAPLDRRVMAVRTWEATYRTDDGGAHWVTIGTPLPPANVMEMRFDGDTVDVLTVLNQDELLRSADGGDHWRSLSNTLRRPVTTWATHPSNASIVLAGTKRGLFVTQNGGATWTAAFTGIRRAAATLFVGGAISATLYAQVDDEWLASHDQGRTWIAISEPAPLETTLLGSLKESHAGVVDRFTASHGEIVTSGGASPLRPERLFLGTGGLLARPQIWRSDDDGAEWTLVRTCSDRWAGSSCGVHVDPHDPDVVFALTGGEIIDGGATLARSTDAGLTWTEVGALGSIHLFALVATTPTTVLEPIS